MALARFKENAPRHGSPLGLAIYWKDVLDNHTEEAVGCSIADFKSRSEICVSQMRECADHLDKIIRGTTIARGAGSVGKTVGVALVLVGGLVAAPFTLGASLIIAGRVVQLAVLTTKETAKLVELGWKRSDTKKAQQAFDDLTGVMLLLKELIEICLNVFSTAHVYLLAETGEDFLKSLKDRLNKDGEPSDEKSVTLKIISDLALRASISSAAEGTSREILEKYMTESCQGLRTNVWGTVDELSANNIQ